MDTIKSCSILIGMHPDEATEEIVNIALELGKPFAVVPCCVFPHLFHERRNQKGGKVTSYEEFVDYLQEKDPQQRIERTFLPFEGRNQVLFRRIIGTANQQKDLV